MGSPSHVKVGWNALFAGGRRYDYVSSKERHHLYPRQSYIPTASSQLSRRSLGSRRFQNEQRFVGMWLFPLSFRFACIQRNKWDIAKKRFLRRAEIFQESGQAALPCGLNRLLQ